MASETTVPAALVGCRAAKAVKDVLKERGWLATAGVKPATIGGPIAFPLCPEALESVRAAVEAGEVGEAPALHVVESIQMLPLDLFAKRARPPQPTSKPQAAGRSRSEVHAAASVHVASSAHAAGSVRPAATRPTLRDRCNQRIRWLILRMRRSTLVSIVFTAARALHADLVRRSRCLLGLGGALPGAPRTTAPAVVLNDGRKMPLLGLGTWKSSRTEVGAAVKAAIAAGYRHIDCAAHYKNEAEIGAAIAELIADGIVTREELWITSKLWNDSHAAADVPAACAKSLAALQLEYLDLYLIHWPVVTGCAGPVLVPSLAETWAAMESLVFMGKARSIGVCNWSAKKLAAMKSHAKIFPAVNQVEMHPAWRQEELMAACTALGTHVTAAAPLGSPDSSRMLKHEGASVLASPVVSGIADALGRSPAQVLIRWALQRGTSATPKSVTPSRIKDNSDVFGWVLDDKQLSMLDAVEPQVRMLTGKAYLTRGGPYKTLRDMWDGA